MEGENMSFYKMLSHRFRKMHKFAKNVLFLTIASMITTYIFAAVVYMIAPQLPDYLLAMSLYDGLMEAAPATLAAGVCAAIISDIALAKGNDGGGER